MANKRKRPGNLTAEDHARHAEIQRMVRERIAYHEKAREEDERRAARRGWRNLGRRLRERLQFPA